MEIKKEYEIKDIPLADGSLIKATVLGKGEKNLIIIPGISVDSMSRIAKSLCRQYSPLAEKYKVTILDYKDIIDRYYPIENIAKDVIFALDYLKIKSAAFYGHSLGGMVAQSVAIDFPQYVEKLVLCCTCSQPSACLIPVIKKWKAIAEKADVVSLATDMIERIYSSETLEKMGTAFRFIAQTYKPERCIPFYYLTDSCLNYNRTEELKRINAKTLVIGGEKDNIMGVESSKIIADKIPFCDCYIYENGSHTPADEHSDFFIRLLSFLEGKDF